MQLYETKTTWGAKGTWHGTRGDAHTAAKDTPVREQSRIYLWEVPTGKADVLAILNGGRPAMQLVQAWGLTVRGGLADILPETALSELDEDADHDTAPDNDDVPPAQPHTRRTGETPDAFWARMEAERKAAKATKQTTRTTPTQEDLDAL